MFHIHPYSIFVVLAKNAFKKIPASNPTNHPASITQLHPLAHQIEAIHQLRPCKGRGIAT